MFIFVVSIVISFLLFHFILAPKASNISQVILTSLTLGRLFIVHTPFINRVAGNMAMAAFFAPLISTSPFKGVGPVITNFSKFIPPKD